MKIIKIRYSSEPRDRTYVKGYGFLSFAKNMVMIVLKNLKKDAIKTARKTAIQKTAEVTRDLIGNKIAHKITSISKKTC